MFIHEGITMTTLIETANDAQVLLDHGFTIQLLDLNAVEELAQVGDGSIPAQLERVNIKVRNQPVLTVILDSQTEATELYSRLRTLWMSCLGAREVRP
jgi:hypothetical protein